MTSNELVEQLKNQGNAAFSAGRFEEAVSHFTAAIEADPSNAVLYSNRSAAHASRKSWDAALQDAERAVELVPTWSKGYGRRGAALLGMGSYAEAKVAYAKGLEIEPENAQMRKGLESAEARLGEKPSTFENPFADPNLAARLAADPKTAPLLAQPDFMRKLGEIQRDPKALERHLGDPRMMQALAAILGVNISTMSPDDISPPGEAKDPQPSARPGQQPAREPQAEPADPAKQEAGREKEAGNEAYKQRDFDSAMRHYDRAFELDPENMSLLSNKAAVLFEMGDFDGSIEACERAVDLGREQRADFKLIAKAFGRIGQAYVRKDDLDSAIKYFGKSLTEHRTPDILAKLRETEKLREQRTKEAYSSPEIAEQERNLGNELFKQGRFAEAVAHYTEAIKRDERDPRAYSNRAACYTKLAAVPEGLKDCDTCLALDATFVKGYIRKAALLAIKKDWAGCLETAQQAQQHDTEGKHQAEIRGQIARCYGEMQRTSDATTEEGVSKRAMQDPEVQAILNDPVMRQILSQMQSDPAAIQEHMRNPLVASKIRKLAAAGVIRTS